MCVQILKKSFVSFDISKYLVGKDGWHGKDEVVLDEAHAKQITAQTLILHTWWVHTLQVKRQVSVFQTSSIHTYTHTFVFLSL
jgi:hypothetical protein